jgi:hypothetical protein
VERYLLGIRVLFSDKYVLIDNNLVGNKSTSGMAIARILSIYQKKSSKRSNERVLDALRSLDSPKYVMSTDTTRP